jgi:hypothetical protein
MRRLVLAGAAVAIAMAAGLAVPAAADQQVRPRQRAAVKVLKQRANLAMALRRGFARLDRDGSGSVSRQEWLRRPELFDRLDADKDDQLTPNELARKVRPLRQLRKLRQMRQARQI